MLSRRLARFVPLTFLPLVLACGSAVQHAAQKPLPQPAPVPVAEAAPPVVVPPPPPVEDPVITLIADSERHFEAGQKELDLGHVTAAKTEFDKAIDVLLESPYGGRTEPRIREHFDRLVDRISAYEVKALAQGDGFTEKQYEPATIDELLAVSATLSPTPATPAVEDAVSSDLRSIEYDIPIPLNQRVLSFVQLFQGRLHDFLEEGMRRGSQYLPMIQNVFRAEGLPLDLAYVPLVESAFKPSALSRTKAKGVWQFMRDTGLENGLRQDWYIDERSDPEKATIAAAKYLSMLGKLFDGDWHLALASYNGGPGRLQNAIKMGRQTDFWKLSEKSRLLPRETRDYVPMILAAIVIAKNPLQYGFEFESEPAHQYETVNLPRAVDLRRIAEWTNTTIDEIQALNPELRRWTTPVRDSAYALKVPAGTAEVVRVRLDEESTTDLASLNWYVVKRGDTLALIARKLNVSRGDLAEANYIKATARVSPGDKLIVPREATALMAARTDRPVPATDSRPLVADKVVPAIDSPGSVKVIYQVKSGDTLSSIARFFSTNVAAIQNWNHLSDTQIRAGERLTIYTSRAN
ncbi:MAG TPA: LysM peptidoglycan-binding domain-containing protein [Vicinamibacterales bacterium]